MGMLFYAGTAPATSQEYTERINEPTIWEGGHGTSVVFCGQIMAWEKYVRMSSGVVDTGMDEVFIDPPVFRAFLAESLKRLAQDGYLVRRMMRGVVQLALFLDERANGEPLPLPPGFGVVLEGLADIR